MRKTVTIEMQGTGGAGQLLLDDMDVSAAVYGYTVHHRVGQLPDLTLNIHVHDGVRFAGSAYVGLVPGTADLLIALGWTPPEQQDESGLFAEPEKSTEEQG